jgi:hypothetical protein
LAGLFDREISLDTETLRLAHEVPGGWSNIRHFGIAVAVTGARRSVSDARSSRKRSTFSGELENFTGVVSFNGNRFDFEVLRAYGPVDGFCRVSFDVLEELHKLLGNRVKLDQLAMRSAIRRVATESRSLSTAAPKAMWSWQPGR